jgi:hypothetical protein
MTTPSAASTTSPTSRHRSSRKRGTGSPQGVEFAPDSPLEGTGFELSVTGRETIVRGASHHRRRTWSVEYRNQGVDLWGMGRTRPPQPVPPSVQCLIVHPARPPCDISIGEKL